MSTSAYTSERYLLV